MLFDFDYTLADSSVGIIESVNWALASLGMARQSDEAIRGTIGLSLGDTFASLVGDAAAGANDFTRLFIQRADEVMAEHTVLLPGCREAVGALSRAGYRLGVVSTKFRRRIETVLVRDGLREPFEVVVGGEDVPKHKPHPACLLAAIRSLGVEAGETVYVGDSSVDGEAASRAGMPFIAVLTGRTDESRLRAWGPVAVLPGVVDVLEWMEGRRDGG